MEEAEGLRADWRETTTAFSNQHNALKLQRETAETSNGDLNVTLMKEPMTEIRSKN